MSNEFTILTDAATAIGYLLGGMFAMFLTVAVPLVFCLWCRARIARKMGDPFLYGFVPYLNDYLLFRRLWAKPGLFWLYMASAVLSLTIPVLGTLILTPVWFVLRALNYWKLGAAFNKSVLFRIGLIFITPLFLTLLAFGKAMYFQPIIGRQNRQPLYQNGQVTRRFNPLDIIWFI